MVTLEVHEVTCRLYLFVKVGHHFLCNFFLNCSFDRNVSAFSSCEVATHRLSVAIGLVNSRAMDEKRMEKDDISFFHQQIDLFSLEIFILLDSKISLIDFTYFRVGVVIEAPFVRFREDM